MVNRLSLDVVKKRAQEYKQIIASEGIHGLFDSCAIDDEVGIYLKLKILSQIKGPRENLDYFTDDEIISQVKGTPTRQLFLSRDSYDKSANLEKSFNNPTFQKLLVHKLDVHALKFFEEYKEKFQNILEETDLAPQATKFRRKKKETPLETNLLSTEPHESDQDIMESLDRRIRGTEKAIADIENNPQFHELQARYKNELETAKDLYLRYSIYVANDFLNPPLQFQHERDKLDSLTEPQRDFALYEHLTGLTLDPFFNDPRHRYSTVLNDIQVQTEMQVSWFKKQNISAMTALTPFLLEKGLPLTEAISQIRNNLVDGCPGGKMVHEYRSVDLSSGSKDRSLPISEKASKVTDIENDMATLQKQFASINWDELSEQQKIEHAANLAYQFVSIHPFLDGNGRPARGLLDYLLVSNGVHAPLLFKGMESRMAHDNVLDKCSRDDSSPYIDYVKSKHEKQFGTLKNIDQVYQITTTENLSNRSLS